MAGAVDRLIAALRETNPVGKRGLDEAVCEALGRDSTSGAGGVSWAQILTAIADA